MKYIILPLFLFFSYISYSQEYTNFKWSSNLDTGETVFRQMLLLRSNNDSTSNIFKTVPKNITAFSVKTLVLDPVQATYEEYMIEQQDSLKWNGFLQKFKGNDLQVHKSILLNSKVEVLIAKDNKGNKIIKLDLNGNKNFADDKTIFIPSKIIKDTVIKVDIPFQEYKNGATVNRLVKLAFNESSENLEKLDVQFFNRENLTCEVTKDRYSYIFSKVPIVSENRNRLIPFNMLRLNKMEISDSTIVSSDIIMPNSTVTLGSVEYKINWNDTALILTSSSPSERNYLSKLMDEVGPLQDYYRNSTATINKEKEFILIDFWGTWCQPCIAAFPDLIAIYDKFGTKINMISILYDKEENKKNASEIISSQKADWIHLFLPISKSSKESLVPSIFPAYILLDRKGEVIYQNSDVRVLEKILKKNVN